MLRLLIMFRLRSVLLLVLLGALGACDNPPEPTASIPAPANPQDRTATPLPAQSPPPTEPVGAADTHTSKQADKAQPLTSSTPIQAVPPMHTTQGVAQPATKAPVMVSPPALKLDLRLPPELLEQQPEAMPEIELSQPALLPQMFVEKAKEPGPFELNGRLITNDHGDKDQDYWDSVEGAELQFKFRN